MPQIILKNVQFTNVKDKRTGTKTPTTLTQSNVGNSSLGAYVNSANFYKLVSLLCLLVNIIVYKNFMAS